MLLSSTQEVQSPLYGTVGLAQGPEDAALLWASGAASSNARGTHMAPCSASARPFVQCVPELWFDPVAQDHIHLNSSFETFKTTMS